MKVGTSRIDITPDPGVELCGFANRNQPSTHVLDKLYASALYLEDPESGFFLINLDLIGIERDFAARLRENIRIKYNIPENHIQVFATHTHSGPGTIHLNFCGEYNSEYPDILAGKILRICEEAIKNREECYPSFAENVLELGINRRSGEPVELQLKALSFTKRNGDFKAVLINYPMHPVCLKSNGISADYPGVVKKSLNQKLQGNPVVLFGLGAAGDIDPPGVGVDYHHMVVWGDEITRKIIALKGLRSVDQKIRGSVDKVISIEYEKLNEDEIDAYAEKYLRDQKWNKEFGEVFRLAVEKWRNDMKRKITKKSGIPEKGILEISILEIAGVKLIFVSGEMFQKFEKILVDKLKSPFMVISCANGLEGYFPSEEEYEEGGYEVETAIFFYNSFLPQKGSLEMIAEEII